MLANKAINDLNLPVVLVKDGYTGEAFTSFIESLGECCLVFDEFGKMYSMRDSDEHQASQVGLLSLLDGVDKTKRLVIMTENSELDINDFMLNRPSRIYYHFRYKKLDEDSIVDYCNDKKVQKDVTQEIVDLSRRTRIFSFDMLQSIVEEHMRFNEKVEKVIEDLNVDVSEGYEAKIKVISVTNTETEEDVEIFESNIVEKPFYGHSTIKIIPNHIRELNEKVKASEVDAPEEVLPPELRAFHKIHKQRNQYSELYFEDTDIAYESKGRLVYETDGYVIVAEDIKSTRKSYRQYAM